MRTLRMTSGPAAGQSREIDGELVIGREGADLIISDPELSRRHVALRPVERGVEIEDLGSLNGTFVNGQRISSPLVLTAPGTLKLGVSEATVEVSLPQATRMAGATGGPDALETPPEATVARGVPDAADVADLDVTVQRPTVKPDVTAQRPAAGPDVTVQRPVGAAGPPPAEAPPSPPKAPDGQGRSRSGGPPVPLIAGAVALALIIVAVILASGGGEESEKRKLDATLDLAAVTTEDARSSRLPPGPEGRRWTFAGQVKGRPFGPGNVTVAFTREPTAGPPPKGSKKPSRGKPSASSEPSVITARVTLRFGDATIRGTERFRSRQVGRSLRFSGTGRLIEGTGRFEGAKGLFDLTGRRPSLDRAIEVIRWRGSVEY